MNIQSILARLNQFVLGPPSSVAEFHTSRTLRLSTIALLTFLAVFAIWATLVPLDSAIMASGTVVVESKRKKIQHLEGGIIEKISVRNGDQVKAGQILAILNQTESGATLDALLSEQDSILALEARLQTELAGNPVIQFPRELEIRRTKPSADAAISGQNSLFTQRQQSLESQIEILNNRRDQYTKIVEGLKSQLTSVGQQSKLIADEQRGTQMLFNQGLSTLPKLLALKRSRSALIGQQGELTASIAENELKASEIEMEILNLKNERLDKISSELRDAESREFELKERIKAASSQFTRTILKSPSSGTVVALSLHSPGEILKGGDILLEIVPQNDRLIIEAQLKPEDADDVRSGTPARVRLLPYKTKMQPVIEGRVRSVSADRLIDPRTGSAYYEIEIEVEREVVARALGNTPLQPGLPAEVIIGLGSHTMLEYLLAPLTRSLNHALREE